MTAYSTSNRWRLRPRSCGFPSGNSAGPENIRTPTLVITNELDFRVPVDQGLQLFTALRRNGVPSEALVFPDEGHWVLKALNSKLWHETVFNWFNNYLVE